jgi:hypothetical protein
VILSANYPAGDPNHGGFVPQLQQWQEASSARRAKGGSGPGGGFLVSMFYAYTQDDLAWIIDAYVKRNGGKPFRRIVIISHAGGQINGPALNLRAGTNQPNRMFYYSGGENSYDRSRSLRPWKLRPVFQRALGPNGILVLGSCGSGGAQGSKTQDNWEANLQGWASTYGVPVYALPETARPDLGQGVVAHDSQGQPIPFVGFDPEGNRLP